ncbi:FkbM family methyltransferase [Methylobacterium sp. AMS5]|uniref:FkbM family methyltransferase n=1 Tax=Methylobacterium sp. AMS5 TaxID=925818 RepID=UPI00074F8189|nr:FkbM family methyltransferase [Methylobacterium sp. AMS5]AMB47768.1 hypothetical protein Y590_22685 [Methylobacterium sp. AMS5]
MPEPDLRSDDVDAFRLHVCQRLIAASGRTEEDNIDHAYPPYEVAAGQEAFDAVRARFLAYLTGSWDGMARSYGRLEDDASRKLFVDLLLFRVLGCRHVRLDSNTPAYWEARRQAEALPVEPSPFADLPGGAGLCHFLLPGEKRPLTVDCLHANIFFTFLLRQYFFDRGGVRVQPEVGDHVVDAGACFGDTAIDFAETVGETGHVYSFDPLEAHLRIVHHNIRQNDLSNLTVFQHGLSDHNLEALPVQGLCDPGFADEDVMPVRRLDDIVATGTIPRVDFIKMDIEGYELPALRGAEATLRTFRPKLAISVYHRWGDYFEIPDYIASLNLGYRFFLQNYTVGEGETVLYCIAAPGDGGSAESELSDAGAAHASTPS